MRTTRTRLLLIATLVAGLMLTAAQTGFTQDGCAGFAFQIVPFAKEKKVISNTAATLTSSVYAPSGQVPAVAAYISIDTADIRFYVDGSTPTATDGHKIPADGARTFCGQRAIANFKAIRTASDATLQATYFRPR